MDEYIERENPKHHDDRFFLMNIKMKFINLQKIF
jgi:hypothetical protein